MRYLRLSVIILAVSLFVVPCFAQELPSVPKLIEYTGKLSRPNGSPYPVGEYLVNFEICVDANCIIPLWSESHPLVISNRNKKDIDGASSYEAAYSVILGSVDPNNNPLDIIFDQELYLHITEDMLGHDKTEKLTSTFSALSAEYALKVYDSDIENYVDIQNVVINEAKNANTVDGFHATDTLEGDKLVIYGAISTEINNRITAHTSAHGHLSNTQQDELVSGNDTNLHYHASDRDLANSTGVLDKSHLDASQVQMRVTGACGPGTSIRVVNEDGSVVCEPDDVNDAVNNPSGNYPDMTVGYALNANSLDGMDSVNLQKRVTGICSTGYYIKSINDDGSVVCDRDVDTDTDTHLSKSTVQQWANEVDAGEGGNWVQLCMCYLKTSDRTKDYWALTQEWICSRLTDSYCHWKIKVWSKDLTPPDPPVP